MKRAQKRDAVLSQKFWFRKQVLCTPEKIELYEYAAKVMAEKSAGKNDDVSRTSSGDHACSRLCRANGCTMESRSVNGAPAVSNDIEEMYVDEIMNGKVIILRA